MDRLSGIFDEVQRSPSAGFKALVQKLRKTLQSAESEDVRQTMLTAIWRGCMDQCLLCPKKDRTIEKMVLFLTNFISSSVVGEGDDYVLVSGIDHLLQRSRAIDKAVRLRACQLIAGIMLKIQGAEIAEEVLVKMIDVLTPRLRDKAPNVRVWAVKVFEWLQNPESEDDFIIEEITRLLNEDASKEVRVAAVESICLTKTALRLIVARVKDIKPEVRVAAMKRLSDASINAKHLDSASVALIIRFGLNDRDASVKMACKDLVLKWLADYGNNVPKFLRFMDFEMNEEEAETVCHAVMEIVEKGERNVSHDLSVAVRQDGPNWDGATVAKLNPSEILWAFNRCDYAHKHMSTTSAAAFVDALVPDMVTLGAMLQDARKPALYSSAKYQLNVRYLIRLTGFLDASDVCGCKGLVQVFEEMLSDTNLPEMLVEPMLASWQLANGFSGSTASIHAAVALSQQISRAPAASTTPRSSLGSANDDDIALPGDSDEEEEGEERRERHRTLASIRSLQVVCWSLQQHIGNRDTILGFGQYDTVVPFIVECLSQPCPDLRGLSVRCLGLLSLASQEKCQDFHQIILQVARNEIEEAEVRCQALEALVDMATVYGERFQDDSALTQFLLRLQIDGAEPALLRVGAESAAKLLFTGRLAEPKLFANLIKFFFLPELAGARDENKPVEEAYLGSTARLQQILSVFFQAFFVAGNGREDIAFGCTSDLVADLAMLIRDQEIDPTAMGRMAQNLLALCENIKNPLSATSTSILAPAPAPAPVPVPAEGDTAGDLDATEAPPAAAAAVPASQDYAETARNVFRMRLTASLCREILKMGSSRAETAAVKEFIKVMGNLSPQSWMRADLAPTLMTIFDTISQCCTLEKPVRKVLVERVVSSCEELCPAVIAEEEDSSRFQFFDLAPGLGDMLSLTSKDLDSDQTKDLRVSCKQFLRESAPSSSQLAKKPVASKRSGHSSKRKAKKDEEEDDDEDEDESEDDEEDENDAPIPVPKGKATNAATKAVAMPPPAPASNRPSRSSKSAAASKIASQLSDRDQALFAEML